VNLLLPEWTVTITVPNGHRAVPGTLMSFNTVPKLFAAIRTALNDRGRNVTASYDRHTRFATMASSTRSRARSTPIGWTLDRFRVLR